jgi:hypothetical protein
MQPLRVLPTAPFFANNPPYQFVFLTRKNRTDYLESQSDGVVGNPLWKVWQLVWNGDTFPSFFLHLPKNSFQVSGNLLKPTTHWESNEAGQFCFDGSILVYDLGAQRYVAMGVYFLPDEEIGNIKQHSILICYFNPTILGHAHFLLQRYF